MRAGQFARLGIRTLMGTFVPVPPSSVIVSRAGVAIGSGRSTGGTTAPSGLRTGVSYGRGTSAAQVFFASGGAWVLSPPPQFIEGPPSQQYNTAVTVPGFYATGGLFEVDATSTPLLSGVTYDPAGILTYDGVGPAASAAGVVLAYTEPNALPILTVNTGATSGTLPYLVGVFTAEGVLPSGSTLVSDDDANLGSSVMNTWPDGSARVSVVAGLRSFSANASTPITVKPGAAGTALTVASITSKVTSIDFDFGAVGTASITDFSVPARIWWANKGVICASYRVLIGGLDAIIYIHSFADARALVEVKIENSRVNSALATVPAPAAVAYTNATITINGNLVITQSDPVPNASGTTTYGAGTHDALRAWYVEYWIGGDPLANVTHDTASMQALLCFGKMARASNLNLATFTGGGNPFGKNAAASPWATDVYVPWTTGRQRPYNMGGGSDGDGTIGKHTRWEYTYLQTGSKYLYPTIVANTLACMSFPVNYRDSSTGAVPTLAQVGAKNWGNQNTWPDNGNEPHWEGAHAPPCGLMAFMVFPSPVFIELAQSILLETATLNAPTSGFSYWFQPRGKAWSNRALWHSLYITPDNFTNGSGVTVPDPWRAPAQNQCNYNNNDMDTFRTGAYNTLGIMHNYSVSVPWDMGKTADYGIGFQTAVWMNWFLVGAYCDFAAQKLVTGTTATRMATSADWLATSIIRYVNEQTDSGWRTHRYVQTIGTVDHNQIEGGPIGMFTSWADHGPYYMTDTPLPEIGPMSLQGHTDGDSGTRDRLYSQTFTDGSAWANSNYCVDFWCGFVTAVERDVPGAAAAWDKYITKCTNLSTWLDGYIAKCLHGQWPRNKGNPI